MNTTVSEATRAEVERLRASVRGIQLDIDRQVYKTLQARCLAALEAARALPRVDCGTLDGVFKAVRSRASRQCLEEAAQTFLDAEAKFRAMADGSAPAPMAIFEPGGAKAVAYVIQPPPAPPTVGAQSWRAPRLPPPPRVAGYQPLIVGRR
ncbi:MAG: hypothetical protein ACREUL_18610 [Steroidobacteraceae bacterium]